VSSEPAEVLIVDHGPPVPLTDADVRIWATNQRVFVSSVMAGMERERVAVAEAVESLGAAAVLFERLGGRDDDAETAFLDGVRSSEVYVGILGERYGRRGASGYSATHLEYNEALTSGLRIAIWHTVDELDGPQRDFLADLQVFHTTGSYRTVDDLGQQVATRLRSLAAEAGAPWCKVGSSIFRATRLADTGGRLEVAAVVRNPEVIAALEQLRPNGWGRARPTRISWSGGSRLVRIEEVSVETTPGRGRAVTISGVRTEESTSLMHETSVEGRSAEVLTELAMRIALFGEANPLGTLSFFAEMPNPFAGLDTIRLSEDSVPGIAEVLMVDALVGSGRADRVTKVRAGPRHGGRRRLRVEWLPRQRFSNEVPQRRAIEGDLPVAPA
jgi:hypothetical protein